MKVSLITVGYNAAKTIVTAIESVLEQRGVEVEYLVIDGGSTDGTQAILQEWEPRFGGRMRWISEPDRGMYDAINKGMGLSTGDVIGILNADDILAAPDTLARVAAGFDERTDIVYGDIRFVAGGETLPELRRAPTTRYCTGRFFRKWMFSFATFPAHPSTFIRRSCFERFGGYSLDYRICADFEYMLRLMRRHNLPIRYLPVCTTVMRRGGMSTNGFKANREINREDLRALKANGYRSSLLLIYLKYLFKVWGYFRLGLLREGAGA